MSRGEYGTLEPELMGEKLGKIRAEEFHRALKVEGITDIENFEYVDTRVEANQETIQKVKKSIELFKPSIIFAPEGIYSYYPHKDHVITGLIIYRILKNMAKKDRPTLYMYHSYVNTNYFPMVYWRRQSKALKEHKSQYYMLLPLGPLRFLFGFYFGFRLHPKYHFYPAEAFRKVDFQLDESHQPGLKYRIIGRIASKLGKIMNKTITTRVKE